MVTPRLTGLCPACSLLLAASGCGGFGSSSNNDNPPTSCGAGTHAVNGVCAVDPALAIATGGGSYWRGEVNDVLPGHEPLTALRAMRVG